jgi:hypothetical protein
MTYLSFQYFISRRTSLAARSANLGSANPIIPVLAAFIFFLLFVAGSLWLISRSRAPASAPTVTSNGSFPTAPGSNGPQGAQLPNSPLAPGFPSQGPSKASSSATQSPFGSPSPPPTPTVQLDATSARQLVEAWLSYKKTIFSSPYDLSRLGQFIVDPGPLYSDITRPGGSVDWLRSNNASYIYKDLSILNVSDFRQFPDRAHLTLKILEDLELRTPQGIDKSKSGRKTQSWIYELKLHNGQWLVYDYRKDI